MVIKKKRILLTAGRLPITLDLCRQLASTGHTVFVTDCVKTFVSKYSRTVERSFVVPNPSSSPNKYIEEHLDLARKYSIDLIIPVWEDVLYFSREMSRFPPECKIFADDFETLYGLHHKWLFMKKLEEYGFPAPKSFLVKSQQDVKDVDLDIPFALKPCLSRASQNVFKVYDKNVRFDLSSSETWIAQEWLHGKKFCTLSVCHQGQVTAHGVYPVHFAINNSSCLNFQSVEHPKIFEWVKNFIAKEQFTGMIAFDFFELPCGTLYPIECNPRGTSGIHLFASTKEFADAFTGSNSACLFPAEQAKRQIAIGMLLYGWRSTTKGHHFLSEFFRSKDVLFTLKDPLPALIQPYLFASILSRALKARMSMPSHFTHDLDWESEVTQPKPCLAQHA